MAEEENTNTKPEAELPGYTLEEVAKHNSRDSLWIVFDDKVYDVTKFIENHPGGADALLTNGGKDSTEAFEAIGHSPAARETRNSFLIGKLVQGAPSKSTPTTSGSSCRVCGTCCGLSTITVVGIGVAVVAVAAFAFYKYKTR